MIVLNYIEIIKSIVQKNNGLFLTEQADNNNIPRQYISQLVKEGYLERVSRGVYTSTQIYNYDEMFNLSYRCSKGIFSHETALFIHDMTDRTPLEYTITVPSGYNTKSFKNDIITFKYVKSEIHLLGVTEAKTPNQNVVKVYDLERTICDIIKNKKNMDAAIFVDAINRYVKSKNKQLNTLIKYAQILKTENAVRTYLEVLL